MFTEQEIDRVGQEYNWDTQKLHDAAMEAWFSEGNREKSDFLTAVHRKAEELKEFEEWWNEQEGA